MPIDRDASGDNRLGTAVNLEIFGRLLKVDFEVEIDFEDDIEIGGDPATEAQDVLKFCPWIRKEVLKARGGHAPQSVNPSVKNLATIGLRCGERRSRRTVQIVMANSQTVGSTETAEVLRGAQGEVDVGARALIGQRPDISAYPLAQKNLLPAITIVTYVGYIAIPKVLILVGYRPYQLPVACRIVPVIVPSPAGVGRGSRIDTTGIKGDTMTVGRERMRGGQGYRAGLDRFEESVISSHFMHRMSRDSNLRLYGVAGFLGKAIVVDQAAIVRRLVPILVSASEKFCQDRAKVARTRARAKWREYGHESSKSVGESEFITEVILDKEFSRNGSRYNDRETLNRRIGELIAEDRPIGMVIPALPFKIASPLKSRGPAPDLGEANFLLSLYEIARTVEILYRGSASNRSGTLATFTVVADGSRFNNAVNKPLIEISSYQAKLSEWINLLGLGDYLRITDYQSLLLKGLPPAILSAKLDTLRRARTGYADALWPIFDASDMSATFQAALEVELDPEEGNPEGRFVSLMKSLVYTVNYRSLDDLHWIPDEERMELYRELTAHIFEPYANGSATVEAGRASLERKQVQGEVPIAHKERLRQAMLNEVWTASIDYIAEIKSDRDLDEDPILTCLPNHLRWTIHAKKGQIAIATPPILGMSVQAWAGSAVFRPTSRGKVRLCSLPALLLEATGAVPVITTSGDRGGASPQPLFYVDQGLEVGDLDGLVAVLARSFTRRRFS